MPFFKDCQSFLGVVTIVKACHCDAQLEQNDEAHKLLRGAIKLTQLPKSFWITKNINAQ